MIWTAVSAADPTRFQALTGGMDATQQAAVQNLMQIAQQQEVEEQQKAAKKAAGQ